MNATIEATLTANTAGFTAGLNNAGTQVAKLEQQIRRASAAPLPGEGRSAAASAAVFAAQADSQDKVTAARYRAMEAAAAEESQIRATIRAREAEAAVAPPGGSSGADAAAAAPAGLFGRFANWRKSAMKGLADVGASELVKGLGVGALVAGFRAVLTNAQQVRAEAYAIGAALDPAVERTAAIADTFDRAKKGVMGVVAGALSLAQAGVDRAVAAGSALFGQGGYSENLAAIKAGNEAEVRALRAAARAKENARLAEEEAAARRNLAAAEAAVADARIQAAKAAATDEERIGIASLEVADAQQAVAAAKEHTVERAQAELELVSRQAEQADLLRQRDEAAVAARARADEVAAAAAARREESQARLTAAVQAEAAARARVAAATVAYRTALSDQSAASLADIQAGKRGSLEDRRRAAEVARLRAAAATARDQGRASLIGGELVAQADVLSTRANQVQGGIQSLASSERDPLASVTAQLEEANANLVEISDRLALVEVEN